ncbi:MAG TPA: radical SAM protein [Blastocatellia bacterium]|nr:radical SAM protein [Blastocatellia bacterium]
MSAVTLKELLKTYTAEGELYERLEGGKLRCYACGHRCVILPGLDGICRVRYNEGGRLMVPTGYVGALQCDPTEKKPFFHAYPGSLALTFGMLGCDLHCAYCFIGDTVIITDRGPLTFSEAFESAQHVDRLPDAEIAYPTGLKTVAASGSLREVRAVFKHPYRGQLTVIRPYYLPELRCTPDHRIYATDDVTKAPEPVEARHLTNKHYLAIPRGYAHSTTADVHTLEELNGHEVTYRVPWKLSANDLEQIIAATARGETSRQIGIAMSKDPSYVRHVRSKVSRGLIQNAKAGGPMIEGETLRFPNERRPGIPLAIPLSTDFAKLLGYYCAEGSVIRGKNRPNSYTLSFSFSHSEPELVEEVCGLLRLCLGVEASIVKRATTLAASVGKSSAALLFQSLAGRHTSGKRVPQAILNAPRHITQAFLDAYVQGDGHRYVNGKISVTTVSRKLAYGIAWLALKLGYLPSLYDTPMEEKCLIQGREVNRSPNQYTVVWYQDSPVTRRAIETEDYYLIPVRSVAFTEYEGDVYNMEVEEEHNYLANFIASKNCQNWVTSQALRDPKAIAPPQDVGPEQLVQVARRYGARLVVSSYNEPLITSEWAVEIFKQAKPAGFVCGYVSNGNATPEVLDYIRPWVDLYKIDLKSFQDKNYRKLGGVLQNVLDTIKMVHERGFWLEIVTLIIPGFNDSTDELKGIADFLAGISPDIPWHVTAFHKDYKMTGPDNTPVETLIRAAEIGYAAGLRYVYAGNLPGRVGKYEHTFCPDCKAMLIERYGFRVLRNRIKNGACPECNTKIAGVWESAMR